MADFINEAISNAAVTMTVTALEDNAYKCELASTHGSMTRTITMADGYGAPVIGNLIYYYATEIQLYEDCDDILEWSSDMGLNPADNETRKRYSQLGEDHRELRTLLGEDNYQNMIAALEISQALGSADPR